MLRDRATPGSGSTLAETAARLWSRWSAGVQSANEMTTVTECESWGVELDYSWLGRRSPIQGPVRSDPSAPPGKIPALLERLSHNCIEYNSLPPLRGGGLPRRSARCLDPPNRALSKTSLLHPSPSPIISRGLTQPPSPPLLIYRRVNTTLQGQVVRTGGRSTPGADRRLLSPLQTLPMALPPIMAQMSAERRGAARDRRERARYPRVSYSRRAAHRSNCRIFHTFPSLRTGGSGCVISSSLHQAPAQQNYICFCCPICLIHVFSTVFGNSR